MVSQERCVHKIFNCTVCSLKNGMRTPMSVSLEPVMIIEAGEEKDDDEKDYFEDTYEGYENRLVEQEAFKGINTVRMYEIEEAPEEEPEGPEEKLIKKALMPEEERLEVV